MRNKEPVHPAEPVPSRDQEGLGEFRDVILGHMDVVYRIALRLAGDVHEAEDLVQETFLRAHRAYGRFELRGHGAKPWLLKILHNVFYTRRGQSRREPALLSDVGLDELALEAGRQTAAEATERVDWEEFDEEVKQAVDLLAPEYRSVLLLWALGDLSYKEIAEVLDCAIGTVMSRLFRARQQLTKTLGEYAQQRRVARKSDG